MGTGFREPTESVLETYLRLSRGRPVQPTVARSETTISCEGGWRAGTGVVEVNLLRDPSGVTATTAGRLGKQAAGLMLKDVE